MEQTYKNTIHPLDFCDKVTEAIDLLEQLSMHALAVASTACNEEDLRFSWYIQDASELIHKTMEAKRLSISIRDSVWIMKANICSKNIKQTIDTPESFIDKYLSEDSVITEELEKEFVRNYIEGTYVVPDPEQIAVLIREMPYKEFLKTPYWKFVADARKTRSYGCMICGSTTKLEVHHPTYDFHGYELQNYNQLTVLCHDCHAKFHDKK